jgi:transposase-like protein
MPIDPSMKRPPTLAVPTASVTTVLRDGRFRNGVRCPRCGAARTHRWGTFQDRQRYRCAGCRRTFSDLTGTPAAYTKRLALWPALGALLADGVSVRRTAAILRVHPCTAFRWRHAILRALRECDGEVLTGWIEFTSLRFMFSEKGSRDLRRPARRRGWRPGPGGEARTVHVMVACDRAGHRVAAASGPSLHPPHRGALEQFPTDRIGPRPTLVAEQGRYGPIGRLARSRGGMFHDARWGGGRRPRTLVHVGTAHANAARLRCWLMRFRGVATRYLQNYLQWHGMVDRSWRHGPARAALRWPVGGAFGPTVSRA